MNVILLGNVVKIKSFCIRVALIMLIYDCVLM